MALAVTSTVLCWCMHLDIKQISDDCWLWWRYTFYWVLLALHLQST